jgi:hypothetical protein
MLFMHQQVAQPTVAYPAQELEDDIPVAVVVGLDDTSTSINPFTSPAAAEAERMRQKAASDI